MAINESAFRELQNFLSLKKVTLVAVSKTKPVSDILALYELGQRDFGENYVQELVEKHKQLPSDIRWHFIGHLQRNKVKEIAPFVHLIHGVDSRRLLAEIDKQSGRLGRIMPVLLQIHIAREETKFGLDETELDDIVRNLSELNNVAVQGLMGMASFTEDSTVVRAEFRYLKSLYDLLSKADNQTKTDSGISLQRPANRLPLTTLSMGMSSDYQVAVEEGSNMVRIGSLLFGSRT